MRVSAKATIHGFVEAMDTNARMVTIAAVQIHLAHDSDVKAGDFLEIAAAYDETGAGTGTIASHLTPPTSPSPTTPDPCVPPSPFAVAAVMPPVPATNTLPSDSPPAGIPSRFGVYSDGARAPVSAPARPRFSPTAEHAQVHY